MNTRLTERKGPYDTIFFDLDGTLIESAPGVMNGVRYMFDKIGRPIPDEAQMQAFMGPPIVHHLVDAFGFSEADAQSAYQHFRSYYEERGILECSLYSGIEDVLKALADADKVMYIATSKPEHQAVSILKRMGLLDLCAGVYGGVHSENVFTKVEVLLRAVSLIGAVPAHAVMVGDRYHDVLGAQHIGLDTIGVLYGYGSFDELKEAGCDMIAEYPGDLLELLTEDKR